MSVCTFHNAPAVILIVIHKRSLVDSSPQNVDHNANARAHFHTHLLTRKRIRTYTCLYTPIHTYTYLYTHTPTHTHIHTYTYTHIHKRTYTNIYIISQKFRMPFGGNGYE